MPAKAQISPLGERLSKLKKDSSPEAPTPESPTPKAPTPKAYTPQTSSLSTFKSIPTAVPSQKFNDSFRLPLGNFDIAGARVGMSPALASQELLSKGYKETSLKMGPSFDERVKLKQKLITESEAQSVISQIEYVKGYERIELSFLSFPAGNQLIGIKYFNEDAGLTRERFKELLKDKYGWPDNKVAPYVNNLTWSKNMFNHVQGPHGNEILGALASRKTRSLSLIAPLALGEILNGLLLEEIGVSETTF